ncbi:hypothetical protein LP316_11445 [Thalassotalea sp. LPB0316]|uniref:hypothetical protein n=1 Tax=Thalassotalea sp. LPB0316 TaxID=2769490 RepID=UPI0018680B6E|nr:hypothetical protein [Thalassotalea sp. LPB0316]QOL24920.1 hypothetical protein LP316_11445 [Thalassotalea sp. LPB0316]
MPAYNNFIKLFSFGSAPLVWVSFRNGRKGAFGGESPSPYCSIDMTQDECRWYENVVCSVGACGLGIGVNADFLRVRVSDDYRIAYIEKVEEFDTELAIYLCIAKYYGKSYEDAKSISPFSLASLALSALYEDIRRTAKTIGTSNLNYSYSEYYKGKRIIKMSKTLGGLSNFMLVAGMGAAGYVFGADLACTYIYE